MSKLVRWKKQNGQITKWHGVSSATFAPSIRQPDQLTYCGCRVHPSDEVITILNKAEAPGGLNAICGKCFDV